MKRVVFFLLFISSLSFAQSLYLRAGSGFGLSASPENHTSWRELSGDREEYKSVKFSNGEGLYFNAALGYQLTSSAALELELNYLKGSSNEVSQSTQKVEYQGSAFTSVPSLVLSTGWSIFNPYVRFGAILGFAGIDEKISMTGVASDDSPVNSTVELKYESTFSYGINASLGTYININDMFAVTVDVTSKSLSYSPSKVTIEKYLVNGVDRIHEIPQAQREREFVESYTSSEMNKGLEQSRSFSSLVFGLGLKITL